MDARVRGIRDLGGGVLQICLALPDPSPGHTTLVTELDSLLKQMDQVAPVQMQGQAEEHSAIASMQAHRKDAESQLRHLKHVGKLAAKEHPDLAAKLRITPRPTSNRVFRNAARAVQAEADANKDLLGTLGMSATVFTELGATLDEFDKSADRADAARVAHVSASAELEVAARRVVQVVRVLDSLYRSRFRDDPARLSQWESASSGLRTLRTRGRATTPAAPASTTPPAPEPGSDAAKPAA
jgi:hypothetical protein